MSDDALQPEDASAQAVALRLLRVTDRSRAALTERLIERDIAPEVAARVVARLEASGLVDDARLAEETVSRTLARGPAGRARLAAQLAGMGVPEAVAEAALDRHFDERDALADAEALARTKLRALPPRLDDAARARRLGAALVRRGFDEETASEAVRRVLPGLASREIE